jgi:hypothetical protein
MKGIPQQLKTTIKDIEAYLGRQSKETLIALLIQQVKGDDRLRERLLMKAARKGSKKLDIDAFRSTIFSAVIHDAYVHYREMWDYTSGIEGVIPSIREVLKEVFANEVIELSEYAIEEVEEAMHSVDDSAGMMGGILSQLQELHHSACKRARPDPEKLAERLFKWEWSRAAISRPFITSCRSPKSTSRPGRAIRRWSGPSAACRLFPNIPIRDSAIFWPKNTIAANATTRRWN